MSDGQYEEIKLGGVYYYVTWDSQVDPSAFQEKCPKCRRKQSAFKILVTIEDVLKGEARETVKLDDAFRKRVESAVRRHLVREEQMVTPTFGCAECNSPSHF